ncbi:glycoside hydrolase domain-containing protein [Lysinibacillus endophyticus]|uniref:glycoside hydrolase domain-containing protein n=1 Tax=Ureibacillus endophyticus TaxID=1978490 RepID=UPI0020A0722B|nr:glycoside hydrolase domain-containing protein [Lysinibacillus endophyticus]MCP1144757.1 DUF1906 domain-containing protein [Lysinibacillus endophyticus]
MVHYHWGVDSSQNVTQQLYNAVRQTYGKPDFWGRYLTRVEGASEGLTNDEIRLILQNGTKLMPIYNDFKRAVGENHAKVVAMNAAYQAKRLGIKKGAPIFAYIDRSIEVDSDWIRGYVDYLYNTNYKPGFYYYPSEGKFVESYCEAIERDKRVANQSILWSAEPEVGLTTAKDAPPFKPIEPNCDANVWAWQYGRDTENLHINTNLIDPRILDML